MTSKILAEGSIPPVAKSAYLAIIAADGLNLREVNCMGCKDR